MRHHYHSNGTCLCGVTTVTNHANAEPDHEQIKLTFWNSIYFDCMLDTLNMLNTGIVRSGIRNIGHFEMK